MIETSGVIEKEQGNGFYLVTLEQPAGHQCLCRAAGKLTKFRIKLLAGDKVLVEISPYDLTRGRITYRERNGRFKTIEDLQKVPGLDADTLQSKLPQIDF